MAFTKMIWVATSYIPIPSWDYWSSVSSTLFSIGRLSCIKLYNKIAYYAVINVSYYGSLKYSPIFISPDQNAVKFQFGVALSGGGGSFVDDNGITWYYNRTEQLGDHSAEISDPNLLMNDTVYDFNNDIEQAARDLLERVYSVAFQEDYQIGTTYTLNIADKRKTLRKVVGTALAMNVGNFDDCVDYQALSNNVDTVIDTLLQNVGNDNIIIASVQTSNAANRCMYNVIVYHRNSASLSGSCMSKNTEPLGYTTYRMFNYGLSFSGGEVALIDQTGNITYSTTGQQYCYNIGMDLYDSTYSGVSYRQYNLLNAGIDL